jgi:TusA-related sulfurtransferase
MVHRYSTTEVAQIIREELKKKYPTTKFSVRSQKYSGGSSINIYWTDGASTSDVESFVRQFEGCQFDGGQDLKTYHTSMWNGIEVRWGVDFVSCSREYSKESLEAWSNKVAKEFNCEPLKVLTHGDGSAYLEETNYRVRVENGGTEYLSSIIRHRIHSADLSQPVEVSSEGASVELQSHDISSVTEITVTENEERDGVEIRFPEKPNQEILNYLKSKGFRWSQRNSCWYAKRSDKTLAIAHGLSAVIEILQQAS